MIRAAERRSLRWRVTVLAVVLAGLLTASAACAAAPRASPVDPPTSALPVATPTVTPSSQAAATTARLPKPDHVVIVVLENKDVDQVLGTIRRRSWTSSRTPVSTSPTLTPRPIPASRTTSPCSPAARKAYRTTPAYRRSQPRTWPRSWPRQAGRSSATRRTSPNRGSPAVPAACTPRSTRWGAFTNVPSGSQQPWTAWPRLRAAPDGCRGDSESLR